MNEQLNAPVVSVLPEGVQEIAFAPSQATVHAELAANPLAVTLTVSATSPVDSESVIAGTTVKLVVALLVPSEAVIVCVPATSAGTVNVQLQLPVLSAVAVHRLAPPGDQLTVTDPAPA